MSEKEIMVRSEGLVKIYKTKETEVLALQGLDMEVEKGELTALIGNSGSGKSTFLNMIGGIDRPSAGSLMRFWWTSIRIPTRYKTPFSVQSPKMGRICLPCRKRSWYAIKGIP